MVDAVLGSVCECPGPYGRCGPDGVSRVLPCVDVEVCVSVGSCVSEVAPPGPDVDLVVTNTVCTNV